MNELEEANRILGSVRACSVCQEPAVFLLRCGEGHRVDGHLEVEVKAYPGCRSHPEAPTIPVANEEEISV